MAGTLVKSVMLKIVSNDGETEAKLDLITKKANELGRLHPDIKVKVDSAAASAKLAVLRKELKDTGNAAAGDTGTSLKSRLMSLGSAAAVAGGFGGVSKDASLATKVMSGFSLATGLLEAPMAGAIVGVGGLASGLAAAGMGLLAFGAVAKSQYTVASTAAGQVQTAQDAYTVAIAHGTSQAKAYKAEQIAIAKADVEMTPAQIQLSKSIGGAQNAWQSFVQSNTKGVATIMTQGIGLMPKVFASMQPFMAPTEKPLCGMITQLGKGLESSGLKSFNGVMAKNSGPAITKLGQSIGHIVVGLGGIIKAFMPMAQTVMGGLDKITGKFATGGTTLSSHSGFQSLMSMAKTDMPYVIGIVKNLGGAIKNLGSSMTGLSTFSNSKSLLQLALPLSQLLNTLTKANPALLRFGLFALAAGGVAGKMKPAFQGISAGLTGLDKGVNLLGKFGGAAEEAGRGTKIAAAATRIWTGVQAAFDVVMALNPIGLVVIGIAALIAIIVICVIKFKAFRTFWIGLWKDIKSFLGDAVSWIKSHWALLPVIFMGPVGIVVALVKSHFTQIKSIAMSIINDVVGFFRALPGRIISAIAGLGGMLFRAGQNVMRSLISGLTSMIGAVGSSVAGIAGKVAGFFGLSPAREGPLSGGGAPEVRGAHFTHAFAAGMSSGSARVSAAAARVAGAAGAGRQVGGGTAGGGGGPPG